MGVIDDLRSHFRGTRCEKLIRYDSNTLKISGVGAGAAGYSANIGEISKQVKKIREASESAKILDDYQYTMCNLSRGLDKDSPRYLNLFDLRAAVILLITQLSVVLESYERDPEASGQRLDHVLSLMEALCDHLVDQSVKDYPAQPVRFGGTGSGQDPVAGVFESMGVSRAQVREARP